MRSLIIASNVMRRTLSGKKSWLLYVIVPALVISVFVIFARQESSEPVHVYVMNEDRGPLGEQLLRDIEETIHVRWSEEASYEGLRKQAERRGGNAALYIPADYSERLWEGEPGGIQLLQSQKTMSTIMLSEGLQQMSSLYVEMADAARAQNSAQPSFSPDAFSSMLELKSKLPLDAEQSKDAGLPYGGIYLVSGMLLMFVMGLMSSSISSIIEDRNQNTMSRIFAAPVRTWQISLGNFLGSFTLGTFQIVVMMLMTRYVMGFDYGVPLLEHLLVLECFLLATMGIASAIAGLVRNPKALSDYQMIVIIPTCMLGGCFWPVSIMPDFLQKLSNFTPQRWVIDALEQLSAGKTIADVGLHLAVLVLTAVVMLGFGAAILRPSKA